MKQEKEKWIDEVLGSSKEIKRAEASPFLFTRIKEKINEAAKPVLKIIPVRQAVIIAVTFLILLIFNLDLMFNSSSASSSSEQEIYRVAKSYNLLPETDIYQNK
jgi:hypothetical protein